MATSWSLAYSSFFDAARMRDGLVVASWGLYLPIAAKSSVFGSGWQELVTAQYSGAGKDALAMLGRWGLLQAKSPVHKHVSIYSLNSMENQLTRITDNGLHRR